MSDTKERLVKAREDKAKREAAAAEKAEARELEVLLLEEQLEKDHGARGVGFEIIDTVEGPIAVKLGEAVLHSRFANSKVSEADIHDYVFPNVVHPVKDAYLAIVARRPGIALRCASALATLYGAKATADAGKF